MIRTTRLIMIRLSQLQLQKLGFPTQIYVDCGWSTQSRRKDPPYPRVGRGGLMYAQGPHVRVQIFWARADV